MFFDVANYREQKPNSSSRFPANPPAKNYHLFRWSLMTTNDFCKSGMES